MAVAARPDIYPRGSLVVRTQMLKPKKGNVPLSLPTSLSLSFTHAHSLFLAQYFSPSFFFSLSFRKLWIFVLLYNQGKQAMLSY
jgi:hypothetical protein